MKAERCMRRVWFVGDDVFVGKGAKKRARRWAKPHLVVHIPQDLEPGPLFSKEVLALSVDLAATGIIYD